VSLEADRFLRDVVVAFHGKRSLRLENVVGK
jgi:hypothetical protein